MIADDYSSPRNLLNNVPAKITSNGQEKES